MDDLVKKFEAANPGIEIQAENVPWNSYYDTLYTSLVGGNAPDAAMVKLFAQPRLIEMGALEPIGDRIDAWPGKADLLDNLLNLTKAPDGKQYYLPIQYVVLYLYYRADLFEQAGLKPPTTCEDFRDAAIKLTHAPDTYGFGLRGGKGGWDQWGAFVLSQGAELKPGGLTTDKAVAANQWLIDLFQKDKVIPPSAPNDGFQEIIGAFKSGKTAMTIHHIGSSNTHGRGAGRQGLGGAGAGMRRRTLDLLRRRIARDLLFVSGQGCGLEMDLLPCRRRQQCRVQQGHRPDDGDQERLGRTGRCTQRRFVDATVNSLPFAHVLPQTPATSDFVNTAWQTAMQQALTGQITSKEMMEQLEGLFAQ